MDQAVLYRIAEENITRIHYTQKKIGWYLKCDSSLFGKFILFSHNALANIFKIKKYDILGLYQEQLKNVSSLNNALPKAISFSNQELGGIEKKINNIYEGIVIRSKGLSNTESEISRIRLELSNLPALYQDGYNTAYYKCQQRKSSLELKLSKDLHKVEMIQDYLESKPREVSLLESQHKIQYASIAKCELVLMKSRHIESILSQCLAGIKSITSKQDLLKHLGVAFSDIEDYVNYVTDYTATELLNSAAGISESSHRLSLSSDNTSSHLSALESISEF